MYCISYHIAYDINIVRKFFKVKTTPSQYKYEQTLNITSNQGNADRVQRKTGHGANKFIRIHAWNDLVFPG